MGQWLGPSVNTLYYPPFRLQVRPHVRGTFLTWVPINLSWKTMGPTSEMTTRVNRLAVRSDDVANTMWALRPSRVEKSEKREREMNAERRRRESSYFHRYDNTLPCLKSQNPRPIFLDSINLRHSHPVFRFRLRNCGSQSIQFSSPFRVFRVSICPPCWEARRKCPRLPMTSRSRSWPTMPSTSTTTSRFVLLVGGVALFFSWKKKRKKVQCDFYVQLSFIPSCLVFGVALLINWFLSFFSMWVQQFELIRELGCWRNWVRFCLRFFGSDDAGFS